MSPRAASKRDSKAQKDKKTTKPPTRKTSRGGGKNHTEARRDRGTEGGKHKRTESAPSQKKPHAEAQRRGEIKESLTVCTGGRVSPRAASKRDSKAQKDKRPPNHPTPNPENLTRREGKNHTEARRDRGTEGE